MLNFQSLALLFPGTLPRLASARRSAAGTTTMVAALLICQCGCVATKYQLAREDTPPAQRLDIAFPPAPPLQSTLSTLISYGGPGSWKRKALWDEYVVTLENHGDQPITIDSSTLTDSAGTPYPSGSDPWALERQSRRLERQYRDHGEAFLRAAGPGVLIVGVGAASISAAAGSTVFISAGIAGAAVATVVALPVYYASVLTINYYNKKAVLTEFKRRRLPLPLTLAPGETRTGSLFFPTVRAPGSLNLAWSCGTANGTSALPLELFHTLHVPIAAVARVPRPFTP
jgi:hypothetical protein